MRRALVLLVILAGTLSIGPAQGQVDPVGSTILLRAEIARLVRENQTLRQRIEALEYRLKGDASEMKMMRRQRRYD